MKPEGSGSGHGTRPETDQPFTDEVENPPEKPGPVRPDDRGDPERQNTEPKRIERTE